MREAVVMRFRFSAAVVLLACCGIAAPAALAANCTTQAMMNPAERNALASAARTMMSQAQAGDVNGLRADTLPAVATDFSGIAQSVQTLAPIIRSATITIDEVYDLDASTDEPAQDHTCSAEGS